MKVGDYVKRTEFTGRGDNQPDYGVILELHFHSMWDRDPGVLSDGLRLITVLQTGGKIKKWYAIHTEVISECG